MNWIYRYILNRQPDPIYWIGFIVFGLAGVLGLLISGLVDHDSRCFWLYGIGTIIFYIATAQIDYSYKLGYSESEQSLRLGMVASCFLWPGHIGTLLTWGFCDLVYNFLKGLTWLQTFPKALLSNILVLHTKLKMPKKIKTIKLEPVPESGAYRSTPAVCESCGNFK